jgi:LytS/YehU family sensor histidine kinase
VVHVLAGIVISMAHVAAFTALFYDAMAVAGGPTTLGMQIVAVLRRYLFMDIMTYCAAVGVYYAFEYFAYARRSALHAARPDAMAARLQLGLAEARLHALRVELNPHFLFNALNAVSGLVRRREHDAAVDMLERVGDLLRTTLNREMPPEIPLSEELGLLRRFVEIELVRFGDRLRVAWDVEPEAREALVPPLILQPLVENALRHGVSRRQGGAYLRISARRAGLHLELTVRDTGDGLTLVGGVPPREGIGLSNTRARLAQLYGPDATSLELSDAAGGGARARLLLPFHVTRAERAMAEGEGEVALGA